MNKIMIVINGKAEAGKDTLCDFVIHHFYAQKISSITPILRIARENGWDGSKDNQSRKFLSDLKRAFVEYNNLPNIYLQEECEKFLKSDNDILFVHIREAGQIDEFVSKVRDTCICCTLLVSNQPNKEPVLFGNDSDDCVENYEYDYHYQNIKPLEVAEKDFIDFFLAILADHDIKPRRRSFNLR